MRNRNMSYPLSHIAEQIKARVIGDANLQVRGLCPLEAPVAHHITFIRSESLEATRRALSGLPATCAAIINQDSAAAVEPSGQSPSVVLTKEPYPSFLNIIPLFFENIPPTPGIHATALVDPSATIGEGASIGPGCCIGPRVSIGKNFTMHPHARVSEDVRIGDGVTLHSGVSIRHGTLMGDRITVFDNAVIGSDGFGFTPDPSLGLRKVPQVGYVLIESDVEVGANSCIDRGAFGATVIGRGTKIDNLVQIGHNAVLGKYVIVCGQVGIAGSTSIGDGAVLGGQVGVGDHLIIGKGVRVGGGSAVITTITQAGDYMGYPAIPANDWRRIQVTLKKMIRRSRKK